MNPEKTFAYRIAELNDSLVRASSGKLCPEQTTAALNAAGDLITAPQQRAYPIDVDGGDTVEQVVVTVHGVLHRIGESAHAGEQPHNTAELPSTQSGSGHAVAQHCVHHLPRASTAGHLSEALARP